MRINITQEELDSVVEVLRALNVERPHHLITLLISALSGAGGSPETVSWAKQCYEAYPRHVGGRAAVNAFVKAQARVHGKDLLRAVKSFAASQADKEPQYIPLAMTWCNQGRWEDERNERVLAERAMLDDPYNSAAMSIGLIKGGKL